MNFVYISKLIGHLYFVAIDWQHTPKKFLLKHNCLFVCLSAHFVFLPTVGTL